MASVPGSSGTMTMEEFPRWEEVQRERHELSRGRIVGMPGGSANHHRIQANLARMCGNVLRGRECRFLGEGPSVVIDEAGSFYHPDGTISCPPVFLDEKAGTLANPSVVFEILSPSTEMYDRKTKFQDYGTLASVREIVLIETEKARVEVYQRREEGWLMRVYLPGTLAYLSSASLDLSLDELYEDAAFGASNLPLPDAGCSQNARTSAPQYSS